MNKALFRLYSNRCQPVEKEGAMSGGQRPTWMVVLTTNNEAEAQIVAGRLETEGLRTFIQREPAGSALGITIGKLGENKVLVLESDYERALDILSPDMMEELTDDNERIIYYRQSDVSDRDE
jgi:hypothetical protein